MTSIEKIQADLLLEFFDVVDKKHKRDVRHSSGCSDCPDTYDKYIVLKNGTLMLANSARELMVAFDDGLDILINDACNGTGYYLGISWISFKLLKPSKFPSDEFRKTFNINKCKII